MRTIEKAEYPRYIFHEDGRCWSDKHKRFLDYKTKKDDEYYKIRVDDKEVLVYVSEILSWFKDEQQ